MIRSQSLLKKIGYVAFLWFGLSSSAWAAFEYRCTGTEPFWSLSIETRGIILSIPDSPDLKIRHVPPRGAAARPENTLQVYETKTRTGNKPVTIVVKRARNGCNDGMSDIELPYEVVYISRQSVFEGCCKPLNESR